MCWEGVVGLQAGEDAGKAKGAEKAVRKEAGRLTKLQEELERLEARWRYFHTHSMMLLSALLACPCLVLHFSSRVIYDR